MDAIIPDSNASFFGEKMFCGDEQVVKSDYSLEIETVR